MAQKVTLWRCRLFVFASSTIFWDKLGLFSGEIHKTPFLFWFLVEPLVSSPHFRGDDDHFDQWSSYKMISLLISNWLFIFLKKYKDGTVLSIKEGHRDDRTDNHASTDLWLDFEQKLYRSQISLITFEMCFNYVVKTFSSEFSLSFTLAQISTTLCKGSHQK